MFQAAARCSAALPVRGQYTVRFGVHRSVRCKSKPGRGRRTLTYL